MKLEGKVALITGGGRGIGRAIAIRLARDGADVAINYKHSDEQAREVAAKVEVAGRRSHIIRADVTHVSEVRQMVAETVSRFGRLDILVNNAGLERRAPFWDVSEDDYDAVVAVNLKAVFFATQAAVRHLREARRPGRIINLSSVHEDLAFPNFSPYCVSKGGVRMFTRTLAVELRGTGITVNNIAPGAIATDMNRALLEEPVRLKELLAKIPLERLGQPEDVAGVASFLASPDADYVTGATYFVDGGLIRHYEEQ